MKHFNDLSEQEQIDIIRFSTDNGAYYYSRIDRIKDKEIIYQGEVFSINPNLYLIIRDGMDRYERYKLSMTQSQAEDIIIEKSTKILSDFYSSKVDTIIDQFEKFTRSIEHSIKDKDSEINDVRISIRNTLDSIVDIRKKLSSSSDVLDMHNITEEFRTKMDEVKSVKDEFLTELVPVKDNVNSLINSLRKIVRPSDSSDKSDA